MFSRQMVILSAGALVAALWSCAVDDTVAGPSTYRAADSALVQISGANCVDLLAGQTIPVGSVCATVSGDNLVVTYSTTGGWVIDETHLWAGLSLSTMPQTKTGNPKVGLFPYNSGPLGGVTSYSVSVPLATFGLSGSMTSCDPVTAFLVAHAVVHRTNADGSVQTETAYGAGPRIVQKGNWATYFNLTLTCTDDKPAVGVCETAFAFGKDTATCFIGADFDGDGASDGFKRWGWSNGPIGAGSYLWPVYAGAGQCDLSKGTLVGTLAVQYDGSQATVTYSANSGNWFDEIHLHVGSEPLARDVNGDYTVAPGQYAIGEEFAVAKTTYSTTVTGLSGSIYVVAHAVACSK